jgi:uncharacterized phage protein gp47/JayE
LCLLERTACDGDGERDDDQHCGEENVIRMPAVTASGRAAVISIARSLAPSNSQTPLDIE